MANHWLWMPYRCSDGRVPDREPLPRRASPLPKYESVQAKLDAVLEAWKRPLTRSTETETQAHYHTPVSHRTTRSFRS